MLAMKIYPCAYSPCLLYMSVCAFTMPGAYVRVRIHHACCIVWDYARVLYIPGTCCGIDALFVYLTSRCCVVCPTMIIAGFSRKIVAVLNENKVEFSYFNILVDDGVREGLKTYSDWPTFPQLYVWEFISLMCEQEDICSCV